jgi:hypothetical protein
VIAGPARRDPLTSRCAQLVIGVERLRTRAAGRLSAEEFEERLGSAHAARTRADLDAVRIDLPMSPAVHLAPFERRAPGSESA